MGRMGYFLRTSLRLPARSGWDVSLSPDFSAFAGGMGIRAKHDKKYGEKRWPPFMPCYDAAMVILPPSEKVAQKALTAHSISDARNCGTPCIARGFQGLPEPSPAMRWRCADRGSPLRTGAENLKKLVMPDTPFWNLNDSTGKNQRFPEETFLLNGKIDSNPNLR